MKDSKFHLLSQLPWPISDRCRNVTTRLLKKRLIVPSGSTFCVAVVVNLWPHLVVCKSGPPIRYLAHFENIVLHLSLFIKDYMILSRVFLMFFQCSNLAKIKLTMQMLLYQLYKSWQNSMNYWVSYQSIKIPSYYVPYYQNKLFKNIPLTLTKLVYSLKLQCVLRPIKTNCHLIGKAWSEIGWIN